MTIVKDFQKRHFANYKSDLSLPPKYNYLYGNPIHPIVPLDTRTNNVFIIGAYPSAKFASIGSERDVPVSDLSCPFSTECYFDGSRVRTVSSGIELEKAYLEPLGLKREQCWITNIVRIFLFKEGHIAGWVMNGRKKRRVVNLKITQNKECTGWKKKYPGETKSNHYPGG